MTRSSHSLDYPIRYFLFLFIFASAGYADTLRDSHELTTSVSQDYDSRSVYSNPAALGFQTALNSAMLHTSFSYGINRAAKDDFTYSISYGYFGFGTEMYGSPTGNFSRYNFAFGAPLYDPIYWGMRYSFSRSDTATLNGIDSMDFGLQIRASSRFSLGLMANRVNAPTAGGVTYPAQFIAGATIRPWNGVELVGDIETSADNFARRFGYQVGTAFEFRRGLKLRVGYHSSYQWQAGLQWNFGAGSLYSVSQPGSDQRMWVTGMQFSPKPYPAERLKEEALKIELNNTLSEQPFRGNFFAKARPSLIDILETLRKAEDRASIVTIVVDIQQFPLGLSAAQDVSDALWRLREKGKRIEAYLGQAGLEEYLIATAAHRIYMEPSGELRLLGLHIGRFYAKGTLDKVGIEAEFLAKGEFKSAPETFTRKESTPKNREATLEELRVANELLVQVLSKNRGINAERWKKITQQAVFSANEAATNKLVDHVVTRVTQLDDLKKSRVVREDLMERSDALALPSRVAVIVAEGDILGRKVRFLSLTGRDQVTPQSMERRLEAATNDPRTTAIVVRVSSPGGEILASHEIAALIERAKKKKPVIISMGDSAASGGYMISAPATRVFAQPLTLTGSIGVFLGKFSLKGLYDKIDLNKEIISDAPHASLFSEARPWTPEQRGIMLRQLNNYYDNFVQFVAKNRALSAEAAEKAAKGRVWLGSQAHELKLVDELGGLEDAIGYAARNTGLPDDYEVWAVEEPAGIFDLFGSEGWFGRAMAEETSVPLLSEELSRHLYWATSASEQPFLYLSPLTKLR